MDENFTPNYFYLLTQDDQFQYRQLQRNLLQATEKRHRNQRLDILLNCIQQIREYCQRGNENDWKRCCVCGVCFLKSGIAINSRQLKFLINKCKSSINGALKLMNYATTFARGDINPEFVDFFPILQGNMKELRQWSVRTPANYDQSSELILPQNEDIDIENEPLQAKNVTLEAANSDNLNNDDPNINSQEQSPIISCRDQYPLEGFSDDFNSITNERKVNDKNCIENTWNMEHGITSIDDFDILPTRCYELENSDCMMISCFEGHYEIMKTDIFDDLTFFN